MTTAQIRPPPRTIVDLGGNIGMASLVRSRQDHRGGAREPHRLTFLFMVVVILFLIKLATNLCIGLWMPRLVRTIPGYWTGYVHTFPLGPSRPGGALDLQRCNCPPQPHGPACLCRAGRHLGGKERSESYRWEQRGCQCWWFKGGGAIRECVHISSASFSSVYLPFTENLHLRASTHFCS